MNAIRASVPELSTNALLLAQLSINGEAHQVFGYFPGHSGRTEIEDYIQSRFELEHKAKLKSFMPLLVAMKDSKNEIVSALGVRSTLMGPLFLEQYLDAPIEREITRVLNKPCNRDEIVEVGALSSTRKGASRYLFCVLTDLLTYWGAGWLSFTGTPRVIDIFAQLDMDPSEVIKADPARLPDKGESWGTYYESNPAVVVGEIARGQRLVTQSGILLFMQYQRLEALNVLSAITH